MLTDLTRCGPQKLAFVLNRCLDRYDQPDDNVQSQRTPSPLSPIALHGIQEEGITRSAPGFIDLGVGSTAAEPAEQPAKLPSLSPTPQPAMGPSLKEDSAVPHILIVDDNALNRRVGFNKLRHVCLLTSQVTCCIYGKE